jgi:hypothetical protein
MNSPYAPPLSPAPQEVARKRSSRTLRIVSVIAGLATMFAAMKLMTMMRSMESLGSELGITFSPLASLLISHREGIPVLPVACGLLAVAGSFLKSRRKLMMFLFLAVFAAAATLTAVAILAIEMQRSIMPLFR